MVSLKRYFGCLLLSLLLPICMYGQSHEMIVPPLGVGQYLNSVIMGDTTATGERADPERVYVLTRGNYYYVNTTITNTGGWVLRIKATEGTGTRPFIIAQRNASTSANTNLMQLAGDAYLKNVVLSGYDDIDTTRISTMQGYLIRINTPGPRLVIDSCVLTNSSGNHIRTDQSANDIFVTNSVFGNMGSFFTSNAGAGKAIDLRAGSIDTLLFRNNTFVNFIDRIVRHRGSAPGVFMNTFIFDHNTVVNGMSFHGTLVLGAVGEKVQITNNLFVDPFALGSDTDATRQAEFNESTELDSYGKAKMNWIFSVPNETTQWTVSNNYYAISDSGKAFFERYKNAPGFAGNEGEPLTDHIKGKIGAGAATAFVKEDAVVLTKTPRLMTNMMDWYRDPLGGNKTKNTPNFNLWNPATDDYNRKQMEYYEDTLDCSYPTTTAAYTGSSNGGPVGDLNWFTEGGIGVKENPALVASNFSLAQNYPNPFNPSTVIRYSIPENAHVTLKVFNLLGQEIAELVNGQQKAAAYDVTFDASKLSTGIYFYTVKAGKYTSTKKMMLIK
ncbi:MAG TPA: T9SS type A sorting domain-containing protein [Ignavibacteriales bacterium]|nr:T9SS type A sorting domain-containing protein [Ignavibacteriales bacterium]